MLPSDLRSTYATSYSSKPITLTGKELDDAMKHLQKYLTQVQCTSICAVFLCLFKMDPPYKEISPNERVKGPSVTY